MGSIDLKSRNQVVQLFTKIQRTSTATIQGTEVADFKGAMFVIDVGTWTANDLTVTFQDSDDNSTWADIATASLDGDQNLAIVTGHANTVRYTGYKGNKRYIGAKITDAANGDAFVGVLVVKGSPKDIPAN
jgi:hypothetical protein